MKQKLALACTLIHTPDVLVLDEPTTGVDPVSRRGVLGILHELAGRRAGAPREHAVHGRGRPLRSRRADARRARASRAGPPRDRRALPADGCWRCGARTSAARRACATPRRSTASTCTASATACTWSTTTGARPRRCGSAPGGSGRRGRAGRAVARGRVRRALRRDGDELATDRPAAVRARVAHAPLRRRSPRWTRVSLEVAPGEIFGFLGANGAGKTTTIRMLCGLLRPAGGRGAGVDGLDRPRRARAVKRRIGYMSQKLQPLRRPDACGRTWRFFGGVYGLEPATRLDRRASRGLCSRPRTDGHAPRLTGSLPAGLQAAARARLRRAPRAAHRLPRRADRRRRSAWRAAASGISSTSWPTPASPSSSPPTTWTRPSTAAGCRSWSTGRIVALDTPDGAQAPHRRPRRCRTSSCAAGRRHEAHPGHGAQGGVAHRARPRSLGGRHPHAARHGAALRVRASTWSCGSCRWASSIGTARRPAASWCGA